MRTTYFWKATHEPKPGVRYVSISRQNLRGAEDMEKYPALMPDWKLIQLNRLKMQAVFLCKNLLKKIRK